MALILDTHSIWLWISLEVEDRETFMWTNNTVGATIDAWETSVLMNKNCINFLKSDNYEIYQSKIHDGKRVYEGNLSIQQYFVES